MFSGIQMLFSLFLQDVLISYLQLFSHWKTELSYDFLYIIIITIITVMGKVYLTCNTDLSTYI